MPTNLDTLTSAVAADPGLKSSVSTADMTGGLNAANTMNSVLLTAISTTHVNDDGLITPKEMELISAAVFNDPALWQKFILGHGNDNGTVETGFHLLQNDGGTLMFQGRDFVDTVADAIYHYGFDITNGRYVNEDGASNETTSDVAGWLNYFLNGVNVVFGTSGNEELNSGDYSNYFAKARNETFMAYAGNDKVWAGLGNDIVYGGDGNDTCGGGDNRDVLFGEAGKDTLYGDAGNDKLDGGSEADDMHGSVGNDELYGGTGADKLHGSDGNDKLEGGDGQDLLYGGEGKDNFLGGAGVDDFFLWEDKEVTDTIRFKSGDSGKTTTTIDTVEGFESGVDKINLAAFGLMTFESLDYEGGGKASCYYDGQFLRIDTDGDGTTNMMVEFMWVDSMTANDFIFA